MAFAAQWQAAFFDVVKHPGTSQKLREASLDADMASWTAALTDAVVESCAVLGWTASAKGHRHKLLPVPRSEYLSLDIMAFPEASTRWRFPVAAMELENSSNDDRIAYSLWKVISVRTDLRAVFCYKREAKAGAPLVRALTSEVVGALPLDKRVGIEGETLLIVGNRGEADTFPYGYFKWWRLDLQTGHFDLL